MNQFGGDWTEAKMQIVVDYTKAWLTIMNKQSWAKTLYFDGFAGSGTIETNDNTDLIKGTALRILSIKEPKHFDMYYFVEQNEHNKRSLEAKINEEYPGLRTSVVQADCNDKLVDMGGFLSKNNNYRAVAFIDPFGMSVNWNSIEKLQGLHTDLWILVPTGLGVNRLLKNDGNIQDSWLDKLELFLGLPKQYIVDYFYTKTNVATLFGDESNLIKQRNIFEKIGELYTERLKTIFTFVSASFVMRNNKNSIMYHFMMATNNATALKIANDVVKPKHKL